jgi:hypothetical protein
MLFLTFRLPKGEPTLGPNLNQPNVVIGNLPNIIRSMSIADGTKNLIDLAVSVAN